MCLNFGSVHQLQGGRTNTSSAGDMLHNFLHALMVSGVISKVKRVILVTGAKQYGVHLGQVKGPLEESDSW